MKAAAKPTSPGPGRGVQASFNDLGTPLAEATFVVVDLETTGGSPSDAGITEIGAVKVRGGEVLGEFQTLVDPETPIPPMIVALTGITDAAIAGAPRVPGAVAAFLEFAAGAVLVAHNAPYDTGFLRGACTRFDIPWPKPLVLDTARISRSALLRDEVPNHRLATLARLAGASTQPCHRALADARATVDVLHFLIGRVGDLGVTTVEELAGLTRRVPPQQRRKRFLADGLPNGPGVYQFLDEADRPLYIGTSRHVRDRVRSYFTAAEQRSRMAEMVRLTHRVAVVECSTALEAAVRESRMLAAHKPPYNRRSRFPEREAWITFTVEPFPRLSVVLRPTVGRAAGARCLGPFPNRRTATAVVDALQRALPLRSCTDRLPRQPVGNACIAADLGHCLAPCDGSIDRAAYLGLVEEALNCWDRDFASVAQRMLHGASHHAEHGDYERAQHWRDALSRLAEAVAATHRHAMLADCEELVAARPTPQHGWEIHVIRRGRLAAAGVAEHGTDPRALVALLQERGEVLTDAAAAGPAGSLTEVGHIHRWLAMPGVRLVVAEPALAMPLTSAHTVAGRLQEARRAASAGVEPRRLPGGPVHRAPTVSRISLTNRATRWPQGTDQHQAPVQSPVAARPR